MKYFKNPSDDHKGLLVISENRVISAILSDSEKNVSIIDTNHGDIDAHTVDQSWIEIQEDEADLMLNEIRSILNQI